MHFISFFLGCCFVFSVTAIPLYNGSTPNFNQITADSIASAKLALQSASSSPSSASTSSSSIDGIKYLSEEDKCIANIRKLIPDRKISRNLGGIVGIGWDALTNKATLPVFPQTYRLCQTVPDGEFLIPDGVVVIPIKEANLHKSSQTFEKFSDYKNSFTGSLSVTAGGGVPGIASVSGSLSVETKVGKEHMEKHKQTAFTNTIEYHAFTLIGTESAGFDIVFEERLTDIVNAIKSGNKLLAQYHAETIIADYGTHVTNKALAGASVTMLSFAETSDITDKKSFGLKVSAEFHASFLGAVDMGTKASADTQNSYDESSKSTTTQSYIITKGGPDVNRLLSSNGDNMQIDSVVGLTREGLMPLYSFVHPQVIKGKGWEDDSMTLIVQDYLYNATQEYIRHNTIPGCTDSSDPSYFPMANVDNYGACSKESGAVTTGGYYQTCEYVESYSDVHSKLKHGNQCDSYMIPNPVTNNFTCAFDDYGYINLKSLNFYVTYKHRVHNVKINGCNTTECLKNHTITDRIKVTANFCMFGGNKGYSHFGGIFQNENIFSDNKRCARGYDEYPILHNHIICLKVFQNAIYSKESYYATTSLDFYGFKSCGDESKCEDGGSRYHLTTINNCPYYYCVGLPLGSDMDYFRNLALPSVIKPPYVDRDMAFSKTRLHFQHEIDKIEDEAADKMLSEDGEEIGEIVN